MHYTFILSFRDTHIGLCHSVIKLYVFLALPNALLSHQSHARLVADGVSVLDRISHRRLHDKWIAKTG